MKGIEVKFTLDIKSIIIILLAGWLVFSGFWVYRHVMANERSIGRQDSIKLSEMINSTILLAIKASKTTENIENYTEKPLTDKCNNCGEEISYSWKFCKKCGKEL